jgi:hypothetical protein
VLRLVRLMFVARQTRWIDSPFVIFLEIDFSASRNVLLASLGSPRCPEACDQLLSAADKAYFLSIAQRPGQKPVPFIPILDVTFEVWFKKVSLLNFRSKFALSSDVCRRRTLFGTPRISPLFSIEIPSASVFSKVPLLLDTPRLRSVPSRRCWVVLSRPLSRNCSTAIRGFAF